MSNIRKLLLTSKYYETLGELDLQRTGEGKILPNDTNAQTVVRGIFGAHLRWNLVTHRPEWSSANVYEGQIDTRFTEAEIARLTATLQKMGVPVSRELTYSAVLTVSQDRHYNPLEQALNAEKWDGVPRLDTWLIDHLGGEETAITRAFSRKWLVAAYTRVLNPGRYFDSCLILEGPQGIGKTTALKFLATKESYYTKLTTGDLHDRDSLYKLAGKIIVEFDELSALYSAKGTESVKSFLTQHTDEYRRPYEREMIATPRTCVFAGTTNDSEYLVDPTGNRRFWLVKVSKRADLAAFERVVPQLWAEAGEAYRAGEGYQLTEDQSVVSEELTRDKITIDPWEEILVNDGYDLEGKTYPEVMKFLTPNTDKASAYRVGKIARKLGYGNKQKKIDGKNRRVFVKL